MNRRRRKDQYLLDVKVHTEARRNALLRWIASLAMAAAVIGATSYGLYRAAKFVADRLVYENPRFAITQINVQNDGVMTPQQVMRFGGVRVGQNIFAVNLRDVRRNLEMIPLVKRVEVCRILPQQLVIRVYERIPVARLQPASRALNDGSYFVDRAGVVMKPIRFDDGTVLQPQSPRPLPVLTGVTLADARVGRAVESEQIYLALELLDRLEQSGPSAALEAEQIDLSKPRRLTLTTKQRMTIRFDVQDFQQQLRRLGVILVWAQQRQKQVASVDLTVGRGVPVTFSGDAPTTLNHTTSAPVRPVSTRRSH
jgi:cell division protein FtsQ